MKSILRFVALLSFQFCIAQTTVNTLYGPVQGAQNGAVVQFLGIPYAKPPVDTLRWRAPQTPIAWTTMLNTTTFRPACPQKAFSQTDTTGEIKGNEDCLYLNVWTPQTGAGSRPVMVFIHGGGNQQGSAGDSASNTVLLYGKNMAERSNVVVVTIQYRLGALGFLVHPGLEAENPNSKSGNYAVLDQILALQWVKNNIHLFGGDSANVTIFGESAGGLNVGNLMLTSSAKGLFERAIIQSAVPNLGVYSDAKTKGIDFVNSYSQATGSDVQKIAALRALPADSLVAKNTSPLVGGVLQMNFQPVKDDVLFPYFPSQALATGNYTKVPVMIGSNADEMSLNAPAVVTPAMVNSLVNSRVPLAYRQQVLALYPPGTNNTQARKAYVDILSDGQFTAPVRRAARCMSANQTEPVWNYLFSHAHTLPQLSVYGAYHGIELLYVFNTLENSLIGSGPFFKPADDSVQKLSRTYWTNFAATANPNDTDLPNWVEFENGNDCYLNLRATPISDECKLREAKLDLWDAMIGFSDCPTTVDAEELRAIPFLHVYPNPSSGVFRLETLPGGGPFWTVYNPIGEMVSEGIGEQIDLSTYPSGMYLLQVKQSLQYTQLRIVKE